MAKTEANIHAYGDLENAVYVAPKGTSVPADLATPAGAFNEVGYISEDGVSESIETNSETFRAWQGSTVVRKSITSSDRTFSFSCLEENAITQGLKYRGQSPTAGTGISTVTVKDQTKTDERAWVIDLYDGDHQKRYGIARGFYEVTGEQTYSASGITMLEITVTPIGEYTEITSVPAVTTTTTTTGN